MKVGDRVRFRVKRCLEVPDDRRDAFLKARGLVYQATSSWVNVEWTDVSISQIGWHPSSLILSNQTHLEDLR